MFFFILIQRRTKKNQDTNTGLFLWFRCLGW